MRFGSLTSSGFGSYGRMLADFAATPIRGNTAVAVRFAPAAGFAGWFGIYQSARCMSTRYAGEGQTVTLTIPVLGTGGDIAVIRHGNLRDYSMQRAARTYSTAATRATLNWQWPYQILGTIDEGGTARTEFASWSLTGVTADNTEADTLTRLSTRAQLTVDADLSGTTATVSLSRYDGTIATGDGSNGSAITLEADGTAGVYGTVTPTLTASISDARVLFRWPASMAVLRDATASPTTEVAAVAYAQTPSGIWTEPSDLTAGTYYYRLRPTSDTGVDGTYGPDSSVVILGPPTPPSSLAYVSGDAAATVLGFAGSATAGATYRLYQQGPADAFLPDVSSGTAGAGATQITAVAVTGYPGTATFWIRAADGTTGTEEQAGSIVQVEYDGTGGYVLPRPNAPQFFGPPTASDTAVSATGIYDPSSEKGVATTLQLFARDTDGTYDYAAPIGTGTLATATPSLKSAALSGALSSGWYYLALKAATAAGTQSDQASTEFPIYVAGADGTSAALQATVSYG